MIFRRSPNVPHLADYREYRDVYLRPDFQYRCAYCLTHEFYFLGGEGGEIDHHRPLNPPATLGLDFSSLRNAYGNLYWTCHTCNSAKANRWPMEEQYAQGDRFLDPCAEDHDHHWASQPDGTLAAQTPTGNYTIRNLHLNRRRFVQFRRFLHDCQRKIQELDAILDSVPLSPTERNALREQREAVLQFLQPPIFDR